MSIPFDTLTAQYPTPFYVFDRAGFADNYTALRGAMQAVYPKYEICYSYKTNYTPYICRLVKALGGYAEVVSDMEYTLARKLGYEDEKIVYNGPDKGPLMDEHLLRGGIVNLDSLDEARRAAALARQTGKPLGVGLRINLDVGGNFISRFGLEPGSDDLNEALAVLRQAGVQLRGLHCHISRCRGLEAWAKRAQIMLAAARAYFPGGKPDYISLGSGMFADMEPALKAQFDNVPTYAQYAEATLRPFRDFYGEDGPAIFTEPGTTVVARYLSFVSTVTSVKEVRGRCLANLDGSYENLGEVCTMKRLPLTRLPGGAGKHYDSIDLMGYTCLEQDLMYPGYRGELAVGDRLVFGNTGGYSVVSKPQFIRPNCRMLAWEQTGAREIMRPETFEDVFDKFVF